MCQNFDPECNSITSLPTAYGNLSSYMWKRDVHAIYFINHCILGATQDVGTVRTTSYCPCEERRPELRVNPSE